MFKKQSTVISGIKIRTSGNSCSPLTCLLVALLYLTAFSWALPGTSHASSTFYAISNAAGSDYLLEFSLDYIENETIEVTNSTALTLNGNSPYFFTNSIAFSPTGDLYGWSAQNTSDGSDLGQLYNIDHYTGEISLIGDPQGAPIWVNGLAFDSTGTLYGLESNLYTIDTDTGVRTQIGNSPIGSGHRGLAIDQTTDTLYAWTGFTTITDQLIQIDKTTGATTSIPIDFDVETCCVGTEFNPDTGEIITIRGGNQIYSTDINTGEGTYLGSVKWNGEDIHSNSLAVTVVPEPVSSTLFVIGGATLGFRRFRKKSAGV